MLAPIWLGCAHAPADLAPEPCPSVSAELLAEQIDLVVGGEYPQTVRYLAEVEQMCCENAALAGRDTSWCDAD